MTESAAILYDMGCTYEQVTRSLQKWVVRSNRGMLKTRLDNSLNHCWHYQRGNQKPLIEERQTTQWPKEKGQKNKQRSTKHTNKHKAKDRVTRTPLTTGGELMCTGRVSSSCSTSDTRRVNHFICKKVLTIPKGVIRSRQSKYARQYTSQRKKDERTNNGLQNIIQNLNN
jgi:hypothetical protein